MVRDRDGRPSVCVCGGSALLGDLLGLSMIVQCDFLPVLSYSRFVLSVFYVSFISTTSSFVFRVFVILVWLSVLANWLARKTPLRTPVCVDEIRSKSTFVSLSFYFIILL